MALFKILKGNKSGLNVKEITNGYCYVTLDEQKMYIDHVDESTGVGSRFCLNADHADTAGTASKLDCGTIGNSETPVYFQSGVPKACGKLKIEPAGNLYSPIYVDDQGKAQWTRNINHLGDLTELFEDYTGLIMDDTFDPQYDVDPATIFNFIDELQPTMLGIEPNFNYRVISFILSAHYNLLAIDGWHREFKYTLRFSMTDNYTNEFMVEEKWYVPAYPDSTMWTNSCYYTGDLINNIWYGPFYEKPEFLWEYLPLSAGQYNKLTGPLGLTENVMYGTALPETGFDGQLFFLAEDAEGTPLYVPEDGHTGEVLIKNSAVSGDYSWKKISAFPEILTATYDTTDTSVSRYTAVGEEALKDGLTIAIKLDATSTAATSNFVLNYNNSGDKQIYDNRGVAMTYYRARAKYILILVYNSTDDCWYSVSNPDPMWPISYTHTTADQKCYLVGYNVATATGSYGINTLQRNQNVYMNPSTGSIYANKVYGAVWNDYAEFRAQQEVIEPGYCVASTDNGKVYKTTDKFQACDGIVSDTFGFSIGETDECKTPLAVAGRVLAYCEGNRYDYHSGDTVCAGPNGKVCKMTREEIREWPDRIVGIVSEIPEYKIWGDGNVPVNGRIWIRIK